MDESSPDVVLLDRPIGAAELRRLVARFDDMVKYVVDVERRRIAIGGEMQADAEQALLEAGSPRAGTGGVHRVRVAHQHPSCGWKPPGWSSWIPRCAMRCGTSPSCWWGKGSRCDLRSAARRPHGPGGGEPVAAA